MRSMRSVWFMFAALALFLNMAAAQVMAEEAQKEGAQKVEEVKPAEEKAPAAEKAKEDPSVKTDDTKEKTAEAPAEKPAEAKVEEAPVDERAAIVNGVVISRKDYDQELKQIEKRMAMMGRPASDDQMKEIKQGTLDSLIGRQLLIQEGAKKSIKVEQADIDKEMETMKKRFPSEEEFQTALKNADITPEILTSQLKERLTVQKLIDQELAEKTKVSDDDAKKYYDEHPAEFKQPEQVRASHILVKIEEGADEAKKQEARKRIEEIQEKLKKGESFETLAKDNSDCPSGANGGDLGLFGKGQMVPEFEKAAFALNVGETSDIIETQFGFHIIKVMEKKADSVVPFEEIKDKLAQYIKNQKMRTEVENYVQELRAKANIETFVKVN